MKISAMNLDTLQGLSYEQKFDLTCGDVRDDGKTGDIALLLGTKPAVAKERALAAAELYRSGRVRYIVPSGGVEWDTDGEMVSEAHFMTRILLEEGIPEEAIILENEATTTKENMIYGALRINRATKFYDTKRIIIVTSMNHMQRSLALAKAFLPAFVEISGYPAMQSKEEYLSSEYNRRVLDNSIRLTKGLVDKGIIEDFDVFVE